MAGKMRRGVVRLQRAVRANEKLLIVAASSCIMSISHTALRPVLPVFAKVRNIHLLWASDEQRKIYVNGFTFPECQLVGWLWVPE